LRGLLHYLWDQAELTRWHPGFAGQANLGHGAQAPAQAAEHKLARGDSLRPALHPGGLLGRRSATRSTPGVWRSGQQASWHPGKPQHLMLLIAEVKEIVPARYGFKAVVKHVPDQAFALDEQLYRRLGSALRARAGALGCQPMTSTW
jgi:hypothetical protein